VKQQKHLNPCKCKKWFFKLHECTRTFLIVDKTQIFLDTFLLLAKLKYSNHHEILEAIKCWPCIKKVVFMSLGYEFQKKLSKIIVSQVICLFYPQNQPKALSNLRCKIIWVDSYAHLRSVSFQNLIPRWIRLDKIQTSVMLGNFSLNKKPFRSTSLPFTSLQLKTFM
jgi:hypothetical protein